MKPAVAEALNKLLAPIQAAYQASPEWKEIGLKAYPPPVVAKKVKKVKDKGSRHPGAGQKDGELPSHPKPADAAASAAVPAP